MELQTVTPTKLKTLYRSLSIVAAPVDGVAIDDAKDGFDLLVLEVLHETAAGTLERDGKDTLTVCESCGVIHGAISEERVDRGEAHVAGGNAVVPVELQVLKKREDRLGPEVVQVQLVDGPLRLGATKRSKSTRLSR